MIKRLEELKIGDKFWFTDRLYLVIDFDLKNYSFNVITDITRIIMVLDLQTYKIIGFDKNTKVIQDKDVMRI